MADDDSEGGASFSRRTVIQLTSAAVALPAAPLGSNPVENWRMPFTPKFVDLVRNYTTTVGTADFKLGTPVNGYVGFTAACAVGDQFYYSAIGVDKPAEREVGRGTLLTGGVIQREPINGTKTNFSSGTKSIALIAAAEWFSGMQAGSSSALAAANNLSDVASASTARANLGLGSAAVEAVARFPVAVPDRATLAIYSASSTAYLGEGGRAGTFVFDSSNRSSEVALDPQQGVYVAGASDPTGAAGAWVRKFSGHVNVKWFGAKGDSNSTASSGTDDTAAIQAAINYINFLGGGTLYFPEGYYKITSYLTLGAKLRLVGANRTSTGLVTTIAGGGGANLQENTRNGSALYSNWPSNSSTRADIVVEHLAVIITNAANVGAAFYDNGGTFITLRDCWLKGSKYGVIFDQSELADVLDCIIEPNNNSGACVWLVNGADLKAGNIPGVTNRVGVHRCQLNAGNTVHGILDDGGNTHSFTDNNYNGCIRHIRAAGVQGLKISGGEFESAANECIRFDYQTLLTGTGVGQCGGVWLGGGAEIIPTVAKNCVLAWSLGTIVIDGVMFGASSTAKFAGAANTNTIHASAIVNAGGGGATFDGRATNHFEVGDNGTIKAIRTNIALQYGAGVTILNSSGVLQAAGFPALTGDVTTPGASLAATIANNAVTYAKFQQVAASSLVGNPTGSLANAQGITLAGGLGFSGSALTVNGSINAAANIAIAGGITSSGGGIGYATGAGGTVTQATSKSTAVTLNKLCGHVTMTNSALAAGALVSFTLNNSQIAADDRLAVWVKGGNASPGSYRVAAEGNAAGARTITVENRSAGSLSEALVLGFEITKVVTA